MTLVSHLQISFTDSYLFADSYTIKSIHLLQDGNEIVRCCNTLARGGVEAVPSPKV
jgi:hypothetical protein